jgi:hypothetical protein
MKPSRNSPGRLTRSQNQGGSVQAARSATPPPSSGHNKKNSSKTVKQQQNNNDKTSVEQAKPSPDKATLDADVGTTVDRGLNTGTPTATANDSFRTPPPNKTSNSSEINTGTPQSIKSAKEKVEVYNKTTSKDNACINNTMWAFLLCTYIDDDDNLYFGMPHINWNEWQNPHGMSVCVGMLDCLVPHKEQNDSLKVFTNDVAIILVYTDEEVSDRNQYELLNGSRIGFYFSTYIPFLFITPNLQLVGNNRSSAKSVETVKGASKKDIHPIKLVNRNTTAQFKKQQNVRSITHRPPDPENDSTTEKDWGAWGKKTLDDYKEYLKTDATTVEGMKFIAETNNVSKRWEEELKNMKTETPLQEKVFRLLKLVAKEGYGLGFNIGVEEGYHRAIASIMAVTGRYMDPMSGVLKEKITWKHLRDSKKFDLSSCDEKTDIQELITKKLTSADTTPYVRQSTNVDARWINVFARNYETSKILECFKAMSQSRSDSKTESVRRYAEMSIVAIVTETFRIVIDDYSFKSNPFSIPDTRDNEKVPKLPLEEPVRTKDEEEESDSDLIKIKTKNRKQFWDPTTWHDKKPTQKKIDFVNGSNKFAQHGGVWTDEAIAFKINPIVFDDDFVEYAASPFDESASDKCEQLLSFKCFYEEGDNLTNRSSNSPPFLNTFQSLVVAPVEGPTCLTTWMLNKIWLLPKIIHIILAEVEHVSLGKIANTAFAKDLSLYAVRYYTNAYGLSIMKGHGVMDTNKYPTLNYTDFLILRERYDIILAALFIVDCFNVALINPNDWDTNEDLDEKQQIEQLQNAGDLLETMLSSIRNQTHCNIKDIVKALGKF